MAHEAHERRETQRSSQELFPWDVGIFDAHCHPTDTMASIPSIAGSMRARTLTVMATRSQDQELVAAVADRYGVKTKEAITTTTTGFQNNGSRSDSASPSAHHPEKVIPSFGWHPWFSHQLYDDTLAAGELTFDPSSSDQEAQKQHHYDAVLTPSPSSREDEDFIKHLPDPQPLSAFIAQTRRYLEAHPCALVGEIGLDKAFRLPSHDPAPDDGMTPGRRNGQRLSPYRVNMDHQARILKAQLGLAGEMGRAVSVHGVQGPGNLHDTLKSTWRGHEKRVVSSRERKRIAEGVNEDFSDSESDSAGEDEPLDHAGALVKKRAYKPKPFPPRICLHSFSSGLQTLKQYVDDKSIPAKIFFSFSLLVNYSNGAHQHERRKHIADDVIRACPDDRILLESDLHSAGQEMDDLLEEIYRKVCEVKGWDLREGAERIKRNFEEFIFG